MSEILKPNPVENGHATESPPWEAVLQLTRDIVGERLQAHFKQHSPASPAKFTHDTRWTLFHGLVPKSEQLRRQQSPTQ